MSILPAFRPLAFAAASLALLVGCGSAVYQPSRLQNFDPDNAKEVDDTEIQHAFDAKPQLGQHVNVAVYSFDDTKTDDFVRIVKRIPGVESVYAIPRLVVTGGRRFDEARPWDPPKEVSLKKLRLLAARARADVLVVADYGHKSVSKANGLTALSPLIVPVFFTPFLDIETKSYTDLFVIDTRNGYLYGHLSRDEGDTANYETIYASPENAFFEQEWRKLENGSDQDLRKLFADERSAAMKPSASATASVAAPAAAAAPTPSQPAPPPAK